MNAPDAPRVVHEVDCRLEEPMTVKFCNVEVPLNQLCPVVIFNEGSTMPVPMDVVPVMTRFCTVVVPLIQLSPVVTFKRFSTVAPDTAREPADTAPVVCTVPDPAFTEEHPTAPAVRAPEPIFSEVPVIAPKEPVPVVWIVPEPELTEEHDTAPAVRAPDPTFNDVPVIAPKEPVPVVCIVPDPEFTEVHVTAPKDPVPVV